MILLQRIGGVLNMCVTVVCLGTEYFRRTLCGKIFIICVLVIKGRKFSFVFRVSANVTKAVCSSRNVNDANVYCIVSVTRV